MPQTAIAIAHVALTTIAASILGALVLGSRFAFPHDALRCAVQIAVGFLIVSNTVFVLAAFNRADRTHLGVLAALLAIIALVWLGLRAWPHRKALLLRGVRTRAMGLGVPAWLAAAGAYGTWVLFCAMLPPTATDELNHHLAVPARMLEAGGAPRFLDNIYASFPAHGEMLFLLGLGAVGETAARLFHAASAVALALALFGFSRRYLPTGAAFWSVALFFSVPSVMLIVPWAYVDLMFALFALLAVTSLLEFFETRQWRWVLLTGVMAGGALATKYTGLQLILLLMLLSMLEHLSRRHRTLPVHIVALPGVALMIAAPYLWRNWQSTGWPLFPFTIGPFPLGPELNWDADRASLFLLMLASYGSGTTPLAAASWWDGVTAPILVFLGARFNDPRWYDGVVGPVFLLVPLALFGRETRARLGLLAIFAVVFVVYWGLAIRQVRFLIPILPVLSILLASGLHHWRSRAARLIVGACVVASVAVGARQVLAGGPVAFWSGAESRDAFLRRRIPVYPMYQVANQRLGPEDRLYLVNMRNLGYYLRPEWRADFVFESYSLQQQLRSSADPNALTRFFAARGVTHVMLDERSTYSNLALAPGERTVLRVFLDERATLVERQGGMALYRLDVGLGP